jgi:Mrp family chromosome partitioning ATPase
MGERVLLIDADPVKGALTSTIAIGNEPGNAGLADVLGGVPLDQATIAVSFGKEDLTAVIGEATANYDAVLINGPPLGQLSYAADLAAVVGSTLLVVPHREGLAREAEVFARLSKAQLLGYVYNRGPRSRRGRTYYYCSGSSLADLSTTSNGHSSESVQSKPPAN